jgi:hypothetical protein
MLHKKFDAMVKIVNGYGGEMFKSLLLQLTHPNLG